jgi:cbb3-type cytochrome oxidase subunit 3
MAFGKMIFVMFFFIVFVFCAYFVGSAAYLNQPKDTAYYASSNIPIVNSSENFITVIIPITNINKTNINTAGVDFSHGIVYVQSASFDILVFLIFVTGVLAFGAGCAVLLRRS